MRPIGKCLAPLLVAPLLGACAGAPSAPPPPAVQSSARQGVVMPPALGVTPLVVRAQAVEAGVAREVAANCALTSTYATARFATPATVSLPDLGSATPPVSVSCEQGGRKGSATSQPALAVSETGMSGWPAIGVSVGTGTGGGTGVSLGGFWNGGSGNGQWTRVVYPDLLIALR